MWHFDPFFLFDPKQSTDKVLENEWPNFERGSTVQPLALLSLSTSTPLFFNSISHYSINDQQKHGS